MIKTLLVDDSPREKAIIHGIESLSDSELLALILRTGTKEDSVVQLSQKLLFEIGGISQLPNMNYSTLISLKGIKKAKAIALLSIVEIAKRLKEYSDNEESLLSPQGIYYRMKDKMMFLKQEHFVILCLNSKNKVIKEKTIFVGSLNMSVVTPREVFREAISVNSAKLVLCHNHPSGDAYPSEEDLYLTNQFNELGEMMSIQIVDHIIIGWNEYFSFKANRHFEDKQD